jgi:choline kinase
MNLNVLLMCEELTKGMKSIGSKSLLHMSNRTTILDYQISNIFGIQKKNTNLTISTGFDADRVEQRIVQKRYRCNIMRCDDYSTINSAGVIRKYLIDIAQDIDNLLIVPNSVLFKQKVINKRQLGGNSCLFGLSAYKMNFAIGYSFDNNNKVQYIFYDLPKCWSEYVFLNKSAIDYLKNTLSNNTDKLFIFEIINTLISRNIQFDHVDCKKQYFTKIGNIKDLRKIQAFV